MIILYMSKSLLGLREAGNIESFNFSAPHNILIYPQNTFSSNAQIVQKNEANQIYPWNPKNVTFTDILRICPLSERIRII
jgi:hypothetical protein